MAPEKLQSLDAQTAQNVKIYKGDLRYFYNWSQDDTLTNDGTVLTIYLHEEQYWFEFEADVDLVPAPVSGDTLGKVYYTGDGIPKKTATSLATTGTGAYPISYYPLALPTPLTTIAAVGAGDGTTGTDETRVYVWTVVTTWSEESVPGGTSAVTTVESDETVNLSNMTLDWQAGTSYSLGNQVKPTTANGYIYVCVTAGTSNTTEPTWGTTVGQNTDDNSVVWQCYPYNISAKRIYRLNQGDQYSVYQLVAEIDDADTTYSDAVAGADLSTVLPSENWDPPPNTLSGLVRFGNGMLLGFDGKDLYVSERFRPWAFPLDYVLTTEDTIIGIASVGEAATVLTEGLVYIVKGQDPSSLAIYPLPEKQACVSKRSIAVYKGMVIFAGADGLYGCNGAQVQNLTAHAFRRKEWDDYYPTTMHGHVHDDKYFCFYKYGDTEGALVFDFETGDITTLSTHTYAAFADAENQEFYFVGATQSYITLESGDYILLESGDKIKTE